jgi:hypothetical protein
MAKVERNAPCPCGSGKKYKRCCGAERDLAVLPAFGKAESERAVDLLLDLASSPLFSGTLEAAEDEFFGNTFEDATAEQTQAALEHEQTQIAFNTWLIYDAYVTKDRARLLEAVLNGEFRKQFTAGQIRFLERMAASHMRPYEIREVRPDEGFLLRDLWADAEVDVSERAATHFLKRGETFFARVIEGSRGRQELHGAVLDLMPTAMQDLLQSLRASFRAKRRKRPDLDDATFFKEAVPRIGAAWLARFTWQLPALMTSDGEALQAQTLVYDIVNRDALLLALEANPEFDTRDDGGAKYVWLAGRSTIAGTGSTILGSLTLEHSRLQAFVMSDERAERLRHLLERIAPGAVRYRLTDIHDVTKASQATSPPPKSSGIPPEIEAQVLAEFTERYYRAWLDEDIPALGNRTPRNAVKLKTQRAKVAALLREIERHPPHESGVDIAWLWEELKLTDLR